jgi:hypothetical protein
MAFALENMRRIAIGGTISKSSPPVQHHSAVTNDTLATALGANYFDLAVAQLPKGSTIELVYDLDGTPGVAKLLVSANSGTVVTVVLMSLYALAGVPAAIGTANQILKVNAGATALEFAADAT